MTNACSELIGAFILICVKRVLHIYV